MSTASPLSAVVGQMAEKYSAEKKTQKVEKQMTERKMAGTHKMEGTFGRNDV